MAEVEKLRRWSWLAWYDALSGECYGESSELTLALTLSARLAQEPVIDGVPHAIDLYQEPGHRLLKRFALDSSVEDVAEPELWVDERTSASGVEARPRHGHGSRPQRAEHTLPELTVAQREEVLDFQRLSDLRAHAGVPADGRYFSGAVDYTVALGSEGDPLFVERSRPRAERRAAALRANGQAVSLVSSLDFKPLS